jgi:uncharacterized damage-inducible protein DinB
MENYFEYLQMQYELVKESRAVLFEYGRTISSPDFIKTSNSFGRGCSIRNLLVHNANTYEYWIGMQSLKKKMDFTPYSTCESIEEVVDLFLTIDDLMMEFFHHFDKAENKEIVYQRNDISHSTSPIKVFTHVITHEFHHKGQILSLSRLLGYTPVDTDIMR